MATSIKPSPGLGPVCACRADRAAAYRHRAAESEAEAARLATRHDRRVLQELATLWCELAVGAEQFGPCPETQRSPAGAADEVAAAGQACERCYFYAKP